jgi:hypothetical protein
MDTLAASAAYLFFNVLELLGLNALAFSLGGRNGYYVCLDKSSLYGEKLSVLIACHDFILLGYLVIISSLLIAYLIYRFRKERSNKY